MVKSSAWKAVMLLAAAAMPIPAWSITIDFDSLPGMPNSPGVLVPLASQLTDQLQATTGAVFSSAAGYAAVVDISDPPDHAISEPNGLGGANASGQLSYGTPITVTFFEPGAPGVPAVYGFVQIRGDQISLPGNTATLEAFDLLGSSLGTDTAFDVEGGLTLSLSVPGIHSIQLRQNSAAFGLDGTIALDNLMFLDAPPVPEAASLELLCTGLLGLAGHRWAWKRLRSPS